MGGGGGLDLEAYLKAHRLPGLLGVYDGIPDNATYWHAIPFGCTPRALNGH